MARQFLSITDQLKKHSSNSRGILYLYHRNILHNVLYINCFSEVPWCKFMILMHACSCYCRIIKNLNNIKRRIFALFMYNIDCKLLPSHLMKGFYQNNEIHYYCTRSSNNYHYYYYLTVAPVWMHLPSLQHLTTQHTDWKKIAARKSPTKAFNKQQATSLIA